MSKFADKDIIMDIGMVLVIPAARKNFLYMYNKSGLLLPRNPQVRTWYPSRLFFVVVFVCAIADDDGYFEVGHVKRLSLMVSIKMKNVAEMLISHNFAKRTPVDKVLRLTDLSLRFLAEYKHYREKHMAGNSSAVKLYNYASEKTRQSKHILKVKNTQYERPESIE